VALLVTVRVQNLGVQVRKATPSILLAVHLFSPEKSQDNLYLSNYLTLHVKDTLARLQGVGDVQAFGGREYAMRIWLDPDKVAAHNLSATEVLAALRAQNLQVSAGILNQPPARETRPIRSTWRCSVGCPQPTPSRQADAGNRSLAVSEIWWKFDHAADCG
jgi:multidrug efflux pump subunit AcrB